MKTDIVLKDLTSRRWENLNDNEQNAFLVSAFSSKEVINSDSEGYCYVDKTPLPDVNNIQGVMAIELGLDDVSKKSYVDALTSEVSRIVYAGKTQEEMAADSDQIAVDFYYSILTSSREERCRGLFTSFSHVNTVLLQRT